MELISDFFTHHFHINYDIGNCESVSRWTFSSWVVHNELKLNLAASGELYITG
jgi:hypothetical protein